MNGPPLQETGIPATFAENDRRARALSRDVGASESARDFEWRARSVPCQTACPAGTDIPGYLEAVYHGDFAKAYEINLRDNVFPAVLGRVCSRPCESACRHGWEGNGEPVAICFSKRSAADFSDREPIVLPPLFPRTGKRVAVIGAGVAGLAAARDLARLGHDITILEQHQSPGGMLVQGIPVFRLPRYVVEKEIAQIEALGVRILCGVRVGSDVSVTGLLQEYDAVVLAAGTLQANIPDLPGAQLAGVEHGLGFLLETNEQGRTQLGRKAAIIGGGYTAMDCARAALRLGASTTVFYRRGRPEMVVLPGELEELSREGGRLETNLAPSALLPDGSAVAQVRFVRTGKGAPGRDGRARPVVLEGSEFNVEADAVIFATGQSPDTSWIDRDLAQNLLTGDGVLATAGAVRTVHPRIFCAGDFALGATTLISAIGHARKCAAAVDGALMGRVRIRQVVRIEPAFQSKCGARRTTGRTPLHNAIPLHPMPVQPIQRRTLRAEVETGYSQPISCEAAARCYLCHYKFEIDDELCVLCDECIKVKPVPGCIVEIALLTRDIDGTITGYVGVQEGQTHSLYYSRLWIDQNQCVRCGACESACPVNAITIQKVGLENVPTAHPAQERVG
ncbi:MAG: FAD-dependent oxidoreductase [Pseudomonadota bacterium]